jgi:hypothetical protein
MSSATSIKRGRGVPLSVDPPPNVPDVRPAAGGEDASFKPWHFFVLASLIAATAAVILSRRSTPEHLVLISLTVGAAGAAAAALYRTLAPLVLPDASVFSDSLSVRTRAALDREKRLVMRSLKELEFDRAMGKLSEKDFEEMGGRLRARALSLMKQLDEEGTGYTAAIERELQARLAQRMSGVAGTIRASTAAAVDDDLNEGSPAPVVPAAAAVAVAPPGECPACGTANDLDASFCKRCGQRLAAAVASGVVE